MEVSFVIKKFRASVGFSATALALVFLFMSESVSYSFVCQVGDDGRGCCSTPQADVQVKTIGRENHSNNFRNIIPSIIRESRLRNVGTRIPINAAPRVSKPLVQAEETYDFTNTLEGDWTNVVGYVCIKIEDATMEGDFYAALMGLKAIPLGNNEYQSTGWDKKVLWMEVGNDIPQFICGIYVPNYEEDGVVYDNVYYAPNVDYYDSEEDVVYNCDMWLYLDDQDEIEECWLLLLDEDGEAIDATQIEAGDYITTYTVALNMDEPEYFYAATIEEEFQLVQQDPTFFYAHMTPNVDFSNPATQGKIDFDDLELYYILEGSRENEDGSAEFVYSTPKKVGLKWGNKPAKAENWFQHEISGIMNFFMPAR